jgi:hypothetical protein
VTVTLPQKLLELIERELDSLNDSRVVKHVRGLLVQPTSVIRAWDYGAPDEAYPCWSVLEHPKSNTGIAYCEQGFGPRDPWGLVFLAGSEHMSIGMDSGWFPRFLDAYFQSKAAAELPIWRVYQSTHEDYPGHPLTPEADWDSTWEQVLRLRERNPSSHYHCDQGLYRSEA